MSSPIFDKMAQSTPQACIVDLSLPSFLGINLVTPNIDASFTVGAALGTTTKLPLSYEIYVAVGSVTAASLFADLNNVCLVSRTLPAKVFTLGNGVTTFIKDQTYTFGIKAIDALGFRSSSVAILTGTAIASGGIADILQAVADSLENSANSFSCNSETLQAVVSDTNELTAIIENDELTATLSDC